MKYTHLDNQIDPLTKEMYRFYLFDDVLLLDSYHLMKRETKRHKFKTIKMYDRLSHNRRGWENHKLNKEDVPFTDEIKKRALEVFIKNITVCLSIKRFVP